MSAALGEAGRVAVIAAMRPELQPIVKRLGLRREALGSGWAWRGFAGEREVVAVVTSMGTEAAARWTARLLDAHPADHVLVVGVAGGIAAGLEIGELLNPERVVDECSGRELRPVPLTGAAPAGLLLTTDALHNRREELMELRRRGFVGVDMETAAVAGIAEARGLPWSVLRAVSDFAGDPRLDTAVVGLAGADGTPRPAAVARFVLTRPWRVPQLVALGRGARRAVQVSTRVACEALEALPGPRRAGGDAAGVSG